MHARRTRTRRRFEPGHRKFNRTEDFPTMSTPHSPVTSDPDVAAESADREAILQELDEYRSLLYDPLPAAEVNERLIHARIDALLDRLNRLT